MSFLYSILAVISCVIGRKNESIFERGIERLAQPSLRLDCLSLVILVMLIVRSSAVWFLQMIVEILLICFVNLLQIIKSSLSLAHFYVMTHITLLFVVQPAEGEVVSLMTVLGRAVNVRFHLA